MSAPSSRRSLHTSVRPCRTAQASTVSLFWTKGESETTVFEVLILQDGGERRYLVEQKCSLHTRSLRGVAGGWSGSTAAIGLD